MERNQFAYRKSINLDCENFPSFRSKVSLTKNVRETLAVVAIILDLPKRSLLLLFFLIRRNQVHMSEMTRTMNLIILLKSFSSTAMKRET
jgi:hypothetical protein